VLIKLKNEVLWKPDGSESEAVAGSGADKKALLRDVGVRAFHRGKCRIHGKNRVVYDRCGVYIALCEMAGEELTDLEKYGIMKSVILTHVLC